ncbi:MAG: hypothetical protein ACK523_08755, partial [Pirellulaceae bacterium]
CVTGCTPGPAIASVVHIGPPSQQVSQIAWQRWQCFFARISISGPPQIGQQGVDMPHEDPWSTGRSDAGSCRGNALVGF